MERNNGYLEFDDLDIRAAPNLIERLPEIEARNARATVYQDLDECEIAVSRLSESPHSAHKGQVYELRGRIQHLGLLASQLTSIVNEQEIARGFEELLSSH